MTTTAKSRKTTAAKEITDPAPPRPRSASDRPAAKDLGRLNVELDPSYLRRLRACSGLSGKGLREVIHWMIDECIGDDEAIAKAGATVIKKQNLL